MLPSDGGRFEVSVDGNLIYSKLSNGRFPRPGEVEDLIRKL
jgi:selenoprotein W-related protein